MKLGRDPIFRIGLELELDDIINYCVASRKFNQAICENKNFWIAKMNDQPDYNITLSVGLSYQGGGRVVANTVLPFSKYIPNRDVIRMVNSTALQFIDEFSAGDLVDHYGVEIYPGGFFCESPVLDNSCFNTFNRNTTEVTIIAFLHTDIEDEVIDEKRRGMNNRVRLSVNYRDTLKSYAESLRGTKMEYLIALANLPAPIQQPLKKTKR